MEHVVVAYQPGRFAAWPANNGAWMWDGREILVGFSHGAYIERQGHNLDEDAVSSGLARSVDGGQTWAEEHPAHFVGQAIVALPARLRFTHPGLALRIVATGYHGGNYPQGGMLVSEDRGHSWRGPYALGGLMDSPALSGMVECTARTNYLVVGPQECLLFLSARKERTMTDRSFVARTRDGGLTFEFVSWIVSYADPYRAVMATPVRCSPTKIVVAVRRRAMPENRCWVDCYVSQDTGQTWAFLSKVGDTGSHNGNPPALVRLADGRLCCVYGNRTRGLLLARLSRDEGATWGAELVLRDDFVPDRFGDADFGYPRLVQRADGKLVALYYWATRERPHHHIAATLWDADERA